MLHELKTWNKLTDIEKENINTLENNYFEEIYISNDNIKFLFVKKEENIIGYLSYMEYDEYNDIINIIIHKNYRNQGIASSLIRTLNYKHISLEVKEGNNAAINLYKKLNFKKVKVIKGYYKDNKDAYVMHRLKTN